MPTEHVTFRFFSPSDAEGINRLFQTVFGGDRSVAEWKWKYLENPHGDAIVLIAECAGKIIGHYGLVPRKIYCFGSEQIGLQEVDLMVDPENKKGGLFRKLGKKIYAEAASRSIPFTFGFPNLVSLPVGTRILKWRAIGDIALYSLILDPFSIARNKFPGLRTAGILSSPVKFIRKKYLALTKTSGMSCSEIQNFSDSDMRLWNRISNETVFRFVRDREYIAWRYQGRARTEYYFFRSGPESAPAGLAILGIRGSEAYIMDMVLPETDPVDSAMALLNQMIEKCYSRNCMVLRGWAMPHESAADVYRKLGFIRRNSQIYHVIRSFMTPEQNRLFWDPDKWEISIGDSDCF